VDVRIKGVRYFLSWYFLSLLTPNERRVAEFSPGSDLEISQGE
jgi:hypothetical protein